MGNIPRIVRDCLAGTEARPTCERGEAMYRACIAHRRGGAGLSACIAHRRGGAGLSACIAPRRGGAGLRARRSVNNALRCAALALLLVLAAGLGTASADRAVV